MKILRFMLLLVIFLSVAGSVSSQESSVSISLSPYTITAKARIYSENGDLVRTMTVPQTISLSNGNYSIRVSVAGYYSEFMEFELNGENLDLHFDLQENNNWRFLLDLENIYFRVVGFAEHNGEFVALIDTVDQSMFQEYFQGYTANIDIKHYFFSFTSQSLVEVDDYDLFNAHSNEFNLDISSWEEYSELSYSMISPNGTYMLLPVHKSDVDENLKIVNVKKEEELLIDIHLLDLGIPWNDDIFYWSEDESRLILSGMSYSFSGRESYIIDIETDPFNIEVFPVSEFFSPLISDILNVSVVSATDSLDHIVFFVLDLYTNDYYLAFDGQNSYILPLSADSYGFLWTKEKNLIVLNSAGLIEIEIPSLEKNILLPDEILSSETLDRVFISPDLSYLIASSSSLYGEALFMYNLSELKYKG